MPFYPLPFTHPVVRPRIVRRPVVGYPVYSGYGSIGGAGNDIISINNGGTGPAGPPGPQGIQGPPGTPGLVPVTIVTTTPYNVPLTDYAVEVNIAGPSSVVLPASPTGTVFIVKDISGAAGANTITVSATGGVLLDGSATALINTNYGSLTFIFNGSQWNIV